MTDGPDLDWLISVDDHVLEPPHLWVDRVAAKDRDQAPHMEVDDGLDDWVYDGKHFPSAGLSAVAGKSKEEFSPEPLPYSEMRPGCYDPVARIEDMDRCRDPRLAVLPDAAAVLRAAVHGGERPGVRPRLPEDLQRLDARGVVRRRARPLHPAHPDPDVGPAARGRGDGALRGAGRDDLRLLGEPGAARAAHHPRQGPVLGPGDGRGERDGDGRLACTSARRRRCPRSRPTCRSSPTSRGVRCAPRARCSRGCSPGCSSGSRT